LYWTLADYELLDCKIAYTYWYLVGFRGKYCFHLHVENAVKYYRKVEGRQGNRNSENAAVFKRPVQTGHWKMKKAVLFSEGTIFSKI
jgi:hypothetical protein